MWVPSWTARFDGLLQKYDGTVIANLAGHTHTDDFRLINTGGSNPSFVLINPPVSPVYGQNPAFRIVTYAADGTLSDQTTYYLTNLKHASRDVAGRWKNEYTFSRKWRKPQLDATSLGAIYDQIQANHKDRDLWFKLYNVSHAGEPVPPASLRGFYCAIGSLDPDSYEACYCPSAPVNRTYSTSHPDWREPVQTK